MTEQETAVIKAAILWWRGNGPLGMDIEDHIKNPTVNMTTESEKRLARAVGKLLEG